MSKGYNKNGEVISEKKPTADALSKQKMKTHVLFMKKIVLVGIILFIFLGFYDNLVYSQDDHGDCNYVISETGSCWGSGTSGAHYSYEFWVPDSGDYKFHVAGEGGYSPEWSAGGYGPASATNWHYYKKGAKVKIDVKPWNSGNHKITIEFNPGARHQEEASKAKSTSTAAKSDFSTREKGHLRRKSEPERKEAKTSQTSAPAQARSQPVPRPAPKPRPGPASVIIFLEPAQIETNAGTSPHAKVRIVNDGTRLITGLRMEVGGLGPVPLERTSLSGGESFTQVVRLAPAPPGLSRFVITVDCREGAYSNRQVFVNGVGGGQPPEAGPAAETIAPEEIHRLLPEQICDAALVETEDKQQWGMFTRRYGTADPQETILVVINKNYQVQEEVTPNVYERMIGEHQSEMEQQGLTLKHYDNYPVIIEKNEPGRYIAGNFLFSWFACSIQCTGRYAQTGCFDAAVRSVLSKLGYASGQGPAVIANPPAAEPVTPAPVIEPAKLSVWELSPKLIELEQTGSKCISVTAYNYGSVPAEKVELNIIDSDGKNIGYHNFDGIEPYGRKNADISVDIRVDGELNKRCLIVKLTAANAQEAADKIDLETRRPSSVSISVEPEAVVITPDGFSSPLKVILKNSGDLPAEDLAVQCELAGTKYISEEDEEYVGANDTKTMEPRGCDVLDRYIKDNQMLPPAGKLRFVLRKRGGGEIIGEAFAAYDYGEGFVAKVGLEITNKEARCNLAPVQGDEEESFQSVREGVDIGSPFGIYAVNRGNIPAQNVRVEIWEKPGVVAYADIPRLCPEGSGAFACRPDAGDIKKIPQDREFVKLVSAREGKNEYHVALEENGREIAREKVVLIVKGLEKEKEHEKVYTNKKFDFKGKVRVDSRDYLIYETVVNKKACMLVADSGGTLIKYPVLAGRAGYLYMLYCRQLGDMAFRVNRQQQQNIRDFLRLEAAAQVALFFRDAASVALADVGVAYLTGNTSQLNKEIAKTIAKGALKSAAENIVNNPDNYLKAIVVKMCKDAQQELRQMEKEIAAEKDKIPTEEKLNALEEKAALIYSRIVPSLDLIKDLDPQADLASQYQDFKETIKSEVLRMFSGGLGEIKPEAAKSLFQQFGDTIDGICARYEKYARYKQAVKEYRERMVQSLAEQKQLTDEKLANGRELTAGYSKFLNK